MSESRSFVVSVVIPCFNTPRVDLKRSIDSVLAQDYDHIELIVVDDCSSTPFSGLNGQQEYSVHESIRWVSQPQNRGVSAARNAGISVSSGKYVAFLDAGDWWDKEKISAQVAVIGKRESIGLVYCGAEFHPLNGAVSWVEMRDVQKNAYRELLVRQAITGSASAAMVRRDAIVRLGGFETQLEIPEDRDMWLKIAKHHEVLLVPLVLTHIEVNPGSRSSNPESKAESYRRFLKMYDTEIRNEGVKGTAYSHYHVVIAKKFYAKGKYLSVVKHLALAVIESPRFVMGGIVKAFGRLV